MNHDTNRARQEMRKIQLYDGMQAFVPVGTILVKAYFDGGYQVMRCFVPRDGSYDPKADAKRYIAELRILGVAVFLEIEELLPSPKYMPINPDGEPKYDIPIELTDDADNEARQIGDSF